MKVELKRRDGQAVNAGTPLRVEEGDEEELIVEVNAEGSEADFKPGSAVEVRWLLNDAPFSPTFIKQQPVVVAQKIRTISQHYLVAPGLRKGDKAKLVAKVIATRSDDTVAQQDGGEPDNLAIDPVTPLGLFQDIATGPLGSSLRNGSVPVALSAATSPSTPTDELLWLRILAGTRALSFDNYSKYVVDQFCNEECCEIDSITGTPKRRPISKSEFSGMRAYDRLKKVTFEFVKERCQLQADVDVFQDVLNSGDERFRRAKRFVTVEPPNVTTIKQRIDPIKNEIPCFVEAGDAFRDLCLVELIWNYWHEEAGLVQSMKAISRRFQNRRAPFPRDPLAILELDPLRPLNNFLWGYIQDEQARLSVLRRAHEYEHQYGISPSGRAVADLRPADRRSKFLEAFHYLLNRCVRFFRQDDDRTVASDGFPVFNAIKETHYLIAHGAHNQFGDLPDTARQEMLIEQWLLGRGEMREFLRGRASVPYPEPWMDPCDQMKALQGWTDISVVHFHELAVFGEQLLLSIRYGSWALTQPSIPAAVNWARFWRPEIQGYIHAYRAATGVDLSVEPADSQLAAERYAPPSVHLSRRLATQRLS